MWIIPKRSQFYHFVQATEDSNSEYPDHWQTLLESLLWRSKPTRWRTWLQRLKRVSWLSKLCTRTLRPSRQSDFLDALTSSLRATRASRSASPASEPEPTTPDTFGRILRESSRQLDLFGASSKTSPDTLASDSPKFIAAYEIWVTRLRQDSLQRQKSARLTNGSDCLSWPTPKEHDIRPESLESHYRRKVGAKGGMRDLSIEVQKEPQNVTTKSMPKMLPNSDQAGNMSNGSDLSRMPGSCWPTPTQRDHKNPGPADLNRHTPALSAVGQPVPASPSTNGKSRELLWRTPAKEELGITTERLEGELGARMYDKETGRLAQYGLTQQVNWQTPEALHQKGYHNQKNGTSIEKLGTQAGKGKLNPAWVEQLMGLPPGWTDLGSWATESSPSKQRKHSDI